MIEKLKWIESDTQLAYIANEKALEHKINELVDAVNELQTRSENVQDELDRTRKALDIAVDALDRMAIDDNVSGIFARNAIKQIKALEEKE